MKSTDLVRALAPLALLANRHALSPAYRAMQITATSVRACASYGVIELAIELPIANQSADPVYIDTGSFVAVLKSLPAEDVSFDLAGGVLAWTCGNAKGKLATTAIKEYPVLGYVIEEVRAPYEPTDEFYQALELGGLSCTNVALTSAGMYGIVLDNRDSLTVFSSDNVTVSAAEAGASLTDAPEMLTFTPDAVALLRACIAYGEDVPRLYFGAADIVLDSGPLRAVIKQVPPLKHDFRKLLGQYLSADTIAMIPPDRINSFIKRAGALAEAKQSMTVFLGASGGHLYLAFEEGIASSEEFYLVDDVQVPDIAPIQIDSARLARALSNVDYVVLDYAERGVLIFGGAREISFSYLLAGRR
jgi:hypothetical protein